MTEFVLNTEKKHIFVLAYVEKENKYVQLLEIDKRNEIHTGLILYQQKSQNLLHSKLKLFCPTQEKILNALQFDSDAATDMQIKDIKNTNQTLNDDIFMVCIIESILKWYTEMVPVAHSTMESQVNSYKNTMSKDDQVFTFNKWKKSILRYNYLFVFSFSFDLFFPLLKFQ
jgi:hypothetical protein